MQRDVVVSRVATRALALVFLAAVASPAWSLEYPGPSPGAAEMDFDGRRLTARNAVIEVRWGLAAGVRTVVNWASECLCRDYLLPDCCDTGCNCDLADGDPGLGQALGAVGVLVLVLILASRRRRR